MKRAVLVLAVLMFVCAKGARGVYKSGWVGCDHPAFNCKLSLTYAGENTASDVGRCYIWDDGSRYLHAEKYITADKTEAYHCAAFGLEPAGDCSCAVTLSEKVIGSASYSPLDQYNSQTDRAAWCRQTTSMSYLRGVRYRVEGNDVYYDKYQCGNASACNNVVYFLDPQKPNAGDAVTVYIDRSRASGSKWVNVNGLLDGNKTLGIDLCYGDGKTNCSMGYSTKIPAGVLTPGMHYIQLTTDSGAVLCNKATFMVFGDMPAATSTPIPTATSTTAVKKQGDANGDGMVNILDFARWRSEFSGELATRTADFNGDSKVNIADFVLWRQAFQAR